MEVLSGDDYKALVHAIYRLQIHNTSPPEFTGIAKAIAAIIFPYIERRKKQSDRGYLGAIAKHSKEKDPEQPSPDTANGTASSTASGTASGHNKIKPNKIKSIYNKINSKEADAPTAKGDTSFDTNDFFEAAVRRSLGLASENDSA